MKQRTLRKSESALSWEETVRVLKSGTEGVLGAHGLDGYPYTLPLNYAFMDDKIVVHTASKGYLLESLAQNSKASFTVYKVFGIQATTSDYESAMVFGQAEVITDLEQKAKYMGVLAEKFGPGAPTGSLPPQVLEKLTITVIHIEESSGKIKK